MSGFEFGVVLPIAQYGPERATPRWPDIRDAAIHCEQFDVDTLWIPDELVWFPADKPPMGVWDGVSMLGAVAAITSRAVVGSWVLSALHRNAGIIAKTVETLDEISGGRFIFGLGAGHTGPGQAHAFGLPEDHVFDRFDEALAILVPLLRDGRADVEGEYHAARGLVQAPRGPRPGRVPLMIGANGPRGVRHAVRHADIWSCYAERTGDLAEFRPKLDLLERICGEEGRDPASIGRSVGLDVMPLEPSGSRPGVLTGSATEIADTLLGLRDAGFTRAEVMVTPGTVAAFDTLAPVVALLHADAR